MVSYNPKSWLSLIFHSYSRQVMKTLTPVIVFIGVFSLLLCYVILDVYELQEKDFHSTTAMHSLVGIVLGLFLVFRTNTAYDRWWEGRKHWGLMVNNTRNLAQKLNAFLDRNDSVNRDWFSRMIPNFAYSTKEHLRKGTKVDELEETDGGFKACLKGIKHIPNKLSSMMYERANDLYIDKKISGDQLFLLDKELKQFSDILGACERIRNTPIPYSYTMYIKKFIFIYIITLPFGFVTMAEYMTIPIVVLISYVLLSVELIAEEIEDPFGNDVNDLPTDELAIKIKDNVREILLRG